MELLTEGRQLNPDLLTGTNVDAQGDFIGVTSQSYAMDPGVLVDSIALNNRKDCLHAIDIEVHGLRE